MTNNLKIIEMNTKLFESEENIKKLRKKELQLQSEIKVVKNEYNKLDNICKIVKKIFFLSCIALILCAYQMATNDYTLAIDIILRTVIPIGAVLGSASYLMVKDGSASYTLVDLMKKESNLEKVQKELKETKKSVDLAHEKMMSAQNENYIDEIIDILDENIIEDNKSNKITVDKPKTRSLKNSKRKR